MSGSTETANISDHWQEGRYCRWLRRLLVGIFSKSPPHVTMCFPALLLSTGHNQLEKHRAANNLSIKPAVGLRLHTWVQFCHSNVFRPRRPSPATQNVLIDSNRHCVILRSVIHVQAGQLKTETTRTASLTALDFLLIQIAACYTLC